MKIHEYSAKAFLAQYSIPVSRGSTAPPGKRMGHAGAIITGSAGKASEKIKALSQAGATIAPTPAEVGLTTKKVLENL